VTKQYPEKQSEFVNLHNSYLNLSKMIECNSYLNLVQLKDWLQSTTTRICSWRRCSGRGKGRGGLRGLRRPEGGDAPRRGQRRPTDDARRRGQGRRGGGDLREGSGDLVGGALEAMRLQPQGGRRRSATRWGRRAGCCINTAATSAQAAHGGPRGGGCI
jgi:hypothetical protein